MSMLRGKKWTDLVQMVCILISIIIVFTGFFTFKSDTVKWSVKVVVQEVNSKMRRLDIDELEDLADELEDMNVYISPNKVVKGIKSACKMFKDAKLSPGEMAVCSVAWMATGSSNMYKMEEYLIDSGYKKYASYLEAFSSGMVMMLITSILALAYLVLTIIALVKKLNDDEVFVYVYGGAGILLTIINLIMVAVFNSSFATIIYDYFSMDKLFAATFTSFLPLIFGICVILLQIFSPQLCGLLGQKMNMGGTVTYRPTSMATSVSPAQTMVSCPACGAQVNSQSKFCPVCGGSVQDVAAKQLFCPGCHAPISADTMFCPSCGSKCK